MLKEYDELEKEFSTLYKEDKENNKVELKRISDELDNLIKKMDEEEIEELLNRPYPPQYKGRIKELREE